MSLHRIGESPEVLMRRLSTAERHISQLSDAVATLVVRVQDLADAVRRWEDLEDARDELSATERPPPGGMPWGVADPQPRGAP